MVGRKPSKNPKGVHLGIRVDDQMARALDREIKFEEQLRPGLGLTRSDVVRLLIAEALGAREQVRSKR